MFSRVGPKEYAYAILNLVDGKIEVEEKSVDKNYENFVNKLVESKDVIDGKVGIGAPMCFAGLCS